jgi:hypothetical protein
MTFDKKNEFSHNSIDHLPIYKPEEKKFPLEKILYGALLLALIGIGYHSCIDKNNEKTTNAVNYSISNTTPSYSAK